MIVLDTDHLTVFRYRESAGYSELLTRLGASSDQAICVSVISLEEQMRGWLGEIKRQFDNPTKQIRLYAELRNLVDFYSRWTVLPFDDYAASLYARLRKQKLKAGMHDRKIAAIAMANDALLLSANLVHFEPISGLKVQDWLHSPPKPR